MMLVQNAATGTEPAAGDVPFARLQIQPGIHGVTKVRWRTWPQRSWLSWTLAAVYLAGAFALIYATTTAHAHPLWFTVSRYVVSAGWLVLVGGRLIAEGTVSRVPPGQVARWDRQIADPWWTTIHTVTGFVLGLWLVPFVVVAAVTIGWELVEISVPGFGDEEINGNRLTDISVAWLGWLAAVCVSASAIGWVIPFI
jgi:hypothetical protein